MDPKLAEMYGTNVVDESDLEKLAAAELAEGLAGDEEITEDELEMMAQSVLEGGDEEYADDESQEKLAEADYLGRVMAHSYVQELRGIEKEAARWKDELGMRGRSGASALKDLEEAAGKQGVTRGKGGKLQATHTRTIKGIKEKLPGGYGDKAKGALKGAGGKVWSAMKRHKKGLAIGGGAALGAGLLGAGAYHLGKRKESSALDTLIEARVQEILENSGYEIDDGQEKVSSGYDVLSDAVEARAWEVLDELGFEPSWD